MPVSDLTHDEIVELLPRVMRDHFNVDEQAWKNPTPKRGRGEHPDGMGVVNVPQPCVGYDSQDQPVDLYVGDVVITDAKTLDSDRKAHQEKKTRKVKPLGDFEAYVAAPGVVNPNKLMPHEGLIELQDELGASLVVRWPQRKRRSDLRGAVILLARLLVKALRGTAGRQSPKSSKRPNPGRQPSAQIDIDRLALLDENPASASTLASQARRQGLRGESFKATHLRNYFDSQPQWVGVEMNAHGTPHYYRKDSA